MALKRTVAYADDMSILPINQSNSLVAYGIKLRGKMGSWRVNPTKTELVVIHKEIQDATFQETNILKEEQLVLCEDAKYTYRYFIYGMHILLQTGQKEN